MKTSIVALFIFIVTISAPADAEDFQTYLDSITPATSENDFVARFKWHGEIDKLAAAISLYRQQLEIRPYVPDPADFPRVFVPKLYEEAWEDNDHDWWEHAIAADIERTLAIWNPDEPRWISEMQRTRAQLVIVDVINQYASLRPLTSANIILLVEAAALEFGDRTFSFSNDSLEPTKSNMDFEYYTTPLGQVRHNLYEKCLRTYQMIVSAGASENQARQAKKLLGIGHIYGSVIEVAVRCRQLLSALKGFFSK